MSADSHVSTPGPVVQHRPQGCTNFRLRQLTRRVTQHYDQHLAAVGLKITQYSLLSHVVLLGPVQPGELARRMDMDASTLSRNLRPMITAGWIRMGEGMDGRSRAVVATARGVALRRKAQRHWKLAQLSLNHMLGVETVMALHDLLDAGLAAFHALDPE